MLEINLDFPVTLFLKGHMVQTVLILVLSVLCSTLGAHDLVRVDQEVPTIVLDIRYATDNNFTGKRIYTKSRCFVHKDVAPRLKKVQEELAHDGLGLKIWDGFRPFDGQERLWEVCPDPRYVAPPSMGGRHTRGTTIDCTLIDLKTGNELEMPTEFDHLGEKAHRDNNSCSVQARANRAVLRNVMEKHGFVQLPTEWWHFDTAGWEDYPVVRKSFDELEA